MDDERAADPGLDPDRLEAGLQRLRALGYLQSPAEAYLARRVGIRRSDSRTALAVGLWVGGALGLLGSLLLIASAALSEPALLGRPQTLLTLWLEILLVLAVVAALCTGAAAAVVLFGNRRRRRFALARVEVVVVLAPALATAVYLADRLGRTLATEVSGLGWWTAAVTIAIGVGALGSAVAWSVSGAVALARMYAANVDQPLALNRGQRLTPWVLLSVVTLAWLVLGPYRGLRPLPSLDDVVPAIVAAPRPLLFVSIDGVADPAELGLSDAVELDPAENTSAHPAAYWNEVATGFDAREHGVAGAAAAGLRGWDAGVGEMRNDPFLDLLLRHLLPGVGLGETFAADRRELRRPPVWEIAAAAGRRARVVNCWATYPAARREGLEVATDREFLRLYDAAPMDSFLAWPPTFGLEMEPDAWRRALQNERDRVPGYAEGRAWLRANAPADTALAALWDLATAADLHHLRRATQDLDAAVAPTLVVVHLNGLDILGRALDRRPGLEGRPMLGWATRYVRAALQTHAPAEGFSTVVLARAPARTGTPARAWAAGEQDPPRALRAWAAWLLWSQGIVPARDLVLPPGLPQEILGTERLPSFGRLEIIGPAGHRSGTDLERLRSLGYIGG